MMNKIAIIGLPNSGKSSLFNALTGSHQRVANFPGVTVEKKEGSFMRDGERYQLLDLPGLYTLDAFSLDEKVTRDFIFQRNAEKVDKFYLVIDATKLKKSLYIALQLKELNINFDIILNMMDESERLGQKINIKLLAEKLNCNIYCISARTQAGVEELKFDLSKKKALFPADYQNTIKEPEYIQEKFSLVESLVAQVIEKKAKPDKFSQRMDQIFLHPVVGFVCMLLMFLLVFQILFVGAEPFVAIIELFMESLASLIESVLPDGLLKSFLVDAIIGGVGSVIVFLPHILLMFMMTLFLEDVGYLGRVAFLMDYIFRKLGLPGKAVVPLLSSHACAIPGIMGARIISDDKQRLLTMMITPLTSCSARIPVYTLLIGAIIPNKVIGGFLSVQGLVMLGLYLLGLFIAFLVAFVTKKVALRSSPTYILMELPPYRLPNIKVLIRSSWNKCKIFLRKAGGIIFILSMLIWALVTFPQNKNLESFEQVERSYAARLGKAIQPVFAPLGFDWKMTTALIPSFAAREVLVATMATVMSVAQDDEDESHNQLTAKLTRSYSFASLLALLIWFVFSPQCISTVGVLYRETNGLRFPIIYVIYSMGLAYFFSFLAYNLFS